MEINIKGTDKGFYVFYEGKCAEMLTYGEMLGLVSALTLQEDGKPGEINYLKPIKSNL